MRLLFTVVVALGWVLMISAGLRWLGYPPGIALTMVIYFVGFGLASWMFSEFSKQESNPKASRISWPGSGPTGRLGTIPAQVLFFGSALLTFLNPFQAVQHIRHLLGQLAARRRLEAHHQEPDQYESSVVYRLPFAGEWVVINGGDTPATSHSWDILNQRFAYDFVQVDAELRRHRGRGTRLEDYYCYGQPILAAAEGEVVAVRDGIGPSPWVGFGLVDLFCRDFRGNHVVVRHAEHEYGFYAHLQKGSIKVKVGDRVSSGQTLGLCGHSGHSTEPHLHFHVQDEADFFTALGVPVRFANCHADNRLHESVCLVEGQRVSAEA